MQTTITEALQELKTLTKRIDKKCKEMMFYVSRSELQNDPMAAEGGSEEWIRRERQAVADMLKRYAKIRVAVQKKNIETVLTIEGVERTVAEWLVWKRELFRTEQSLLSGLRQEVIGARKIQSTKVYADGPKKGEPVQVVICVDEAQLSEQTDKFERIMGTLDGKLSLLNGTQPIEVPD